MNTEYPQVLSSFSYMRGEKMRSKKPLTVSIRGTLDILRKTASWRVMT